MMLPALRLAKSAAPGAYISLPAAVRLWNFAAKVTLDHRQRAAGQIAQTIGEVAVVTRDHRVVGKTAVLPEHNFAQQVVAQRLDAQHADDGARPHHVAARLAHLLAVKQQPSVRPDLFGQRQIRRHQKRRPIHRVKANNFLAHDVQIRGPQAALVEIRASHGA